MNYNFHKNYSIFWMKDPTSENRKKWRPMVILWKKDNQYFLAKISTKFKKKNKYCCILNNWFEAGLDNPSCVRLDKLVNCTKNMLDKRHYVGVLEETDAEIIQSKLRKLYKTEE